MNTHNFFWILLITFSVTLISACASKKVVDEKQPLPPISKPVNIAEIRPSNFTGKDLQGGLQATYYLKYFKRDVRYLQEMEEDEFESFAGKPILQLNNQFDKGVVFGSGTSRGVAVRMAGYLNFAKTGVYSLQALANDGILLYLDDKLTLSDPKQHADRLTNIGIVTVTKPGWYKLNIDYFQRKGTSALKLYWKKPGELDFTVVPAKAYGHRP